MAEIILPDLGEDIEDATISYWHFEEGDHVNAGDDVVEVTTEKTTFNVQSPFSGIITEILAGEGDTVQSGDILALMQEED